MDEGLFVEVVNMEKRTYMRSEQRVGVRSSGLSSWRAEQCQSYKGAISSFPV